MQPLDAANWHLQKNIHTVNQRYKPIYHFAVPMGWMNDPNGFTFFNGQYHLFYQYNPFAVKWGPMHWGHCTTSDFVKWTPHSVALAPDQSYDNTLGCFSGTALVENDTLYLMYTSASRTDKESVRQQQCLAKSCDGIYFTKFDQNPVVITEQIPSGFDRENFRDPKLFKRDDMYYSLIGGKKTDEVNGYLGGEILLYQSSDLINWNYTGAVMGQTLTRDGVLECPDLFQLDGKDVLICSPQNLPPDGLKYQNSCSSVYFIGELDLKTPRFKVETTGEFDGGFDFYAPQTLVAPDGRVIMISWMNMWNRSYPSAEDGWVGSCILPRELIIRDGKLIQKPITEIENYRFNPVSYSNCLIESGKILSLNGVSGTVLELSLTVDLMDSKVFGIKFFSGQRYQTLLYCNREGSEMVFDRSKSGNTIDVLPSESIFGGGVRKTIVDISDNTLTIRLFLDKCCVEAFLQNGENVMAATVFPCLEDTDIQFYTIGGNACIKNLQKYEIIVM